MSGTSDQSIVSAGRVYDRPLSNIYLHLRAVLEPFAICPCVFSTDITPSLSHPSVQVRIKIEGENEPNPTTPREEGLVPFVFVGTMESIEMARVLLEYHLAHLHEVELLRQEKLDIDQQLRLVSGPTGGAPYPPRARSERNYSGEEGGGRGRGGAPYRGRGRGRGRGAGGGGYDARDGRDGKEYRDGRDNREPR